MKQRFYSPPAPLLASTGLQWDSWRVVQAVPAQKIQPLQLWRDCESHRTLLQPAPSPKTGSLHGRDCPPPAWAVPAPSQLRGWTCRRVSVLNAQLSSRGILELLSSHPQPALLRVRVEYELQEMLLRNLTINYAPQSCFN